MRDDYVLSKLIKERVVTAYSFPIGMHYKDAILHLRNKGYDIRMVFIDDPKGIKRQIGQYSYHGRKKQEEVLFEPEQAIKITNEQKQLLRLIQIKREGAFFSKRLKVYEDLLTNTRQSKASLKYIRSRVLE